MRISLRFIAGAALAASMTVGCTAAPVGEPQQSSQSKLLAPKALFKAKASEATTKELGITEWRIFRSKTDFVVTGYDADGSSVSGTAFRFAKDGKQNILKARVLDGSNFNASYAFGSTTAANAQAKAKTQSLFHRAAADMIGIRLGLQSLGRGYKGGAANTNVAPLPTNSLGLPAGIPVGMDPFGGVANPFGTLGASCGQDLVSMLMGAFQCVSGAGGLGGLQSNPMQLLQCALASQGAATSTGTCQNPMQDPLAGQLGGLPFDPTGMLGQLGMGTGTTGMPGTTGMDPYGMQDPFGLGMGMGGTTGMDPYGGMGGATGADPYGMGGAGAGMDPYGMGLDPMGQGQFDPLGQGNPFGQQGCQSCAGGYDDFGISGSNGGVGFDPGMGGVQDI